MIRGAILPPRHAAGLTLVSSRFVPILNQSLRPWGRQMAACLTGLRRQLLAQLALDRERYDPRSQPDIGKRMTLVAH